MTETWKWHGIVIGNEKKTAQRSKVEGKGKLRKRVIAEEEIFVATFERETDGSRVRMQRREDPWDFVINEPVTVTVTTSQTTLDDAAKKQVGKKA